MLNGYYGGGGGLGGLRHCGWGLVYNTGRTVGVCVVRDEWSRWREV